jgi:maleate isomerase
MLRTRETLHPERLTFHSSRMRMREVTPSELAAMDDESDRCAVELDDAAVDVFGYACLVAIMARGHAYHRVSQERIERVTSDAGCSSPVITSAGALVSALNAIAAKRVALIAPYIRPLTEQVVSYIESEGTQVNDFIALEIAHNLDVGARDPMALNQIVDRLDHSSGLRRHPVRLRPDAVTGSHPNCPGPHRQARRLVGRRHDVPHSEGARSGATRRRLRC